MKERKPLPILHNVEIIDAGSDGQAVARVDDMICFVKGAVPGDIVDVQVTRKKSRYREGKVAHIHNYSEKRDAAFCEHFGVCGGCKWQNMKYEWQLFYKQKQVEDALERIGKMNLSPTPSPNGDGNYVLPIIPSQKTKYYRNKLEFTFSNKRWLTNEEVKTLPPDGGEDKGGAKNALGFHIPKMFDKILDIKNCYLQNSPSNEIRIELKNFAQENKFSFYDIREKKGLLRTLIIRTTSIGEVMVIVVFGEENFSDEKEKILNHLANKFPVTTSLLYIVNTKGNDTINDLDIFTHKGKAFITEEMTAPTKSGATLKFQISPKSFYQTNSEQAYELYKTVLEFAGLKGNELVYDLYTGTGTIANFVSRSAKKVVGIEYIPEAIEDAKINSRINNISNTEFFSGDIKDVLSTDFISVHGKPNVIIADPPRAGMSEDVTRKMLEIAPEKIVYVSCNPSTQARDLLIMKEKYSLKKVQPVDMFPHTHHVENVVLLERN